MTGEQRTDPGRAVDPAAMIGQFMRRRDERAPYDYTAWAEVVMTIPSISGQCWLVSFLDGNVDVWRVEDPIANYQVRRPHLPPGVSS